MKREEYSKQRNYMKDSSEREKEYRAFMGQKEFWDIEFGEERGEK